MPRAIGRPGASACTMASHLVHDILGRTCRITLKLAGIHSSTSDISSPVCSTPLRTLGSLVQREHAFALRVVDDQVTNGELACVPPQRQRPVLVPACAATPPV